LSDQYGAGFERYLISELLNQLDLKDASKGQREKNDQFRLQYVTQEVQKASKKPVYPQFMCEVSPPMEPVRWLSCWRQAMSKKLLMTWAGSLDSTWPTKFC